MFKAKFMWVVGLCWAAIGFFDLLKAEFLPKSVQDYTAIRFISLLSWHSWLIIFLAIVIAIILEGGHAAIEKGTKNYQPQERVLHPSDLNIWGLGKLYSLLS
jgi:hypothetical protein